MDIRPTEKPFDKFFNRDIIRSYDQEFNGKYRTI